ncbi:NeuD/PglB/VioB family sugar acetyltransferase [Cellulomonas sp. Marseille-Q8402]
MTTARRPLVLVGASGLAREVLAVVRAHGPHEAVGVLDDDPATHGRAVGGVPVLGGLDAVGSWPGADVLVCVGRGAARQVLVGRLRALGVGDDRWATVAHPSVEVPPDCEVGPGSVLLAGVVLTTAVTVGAHVVLMPHVTLTHDDRVGDHATLAAGVALGGGVVVGPRAYLGMRSSVRERVRVGADATLGMGAVLLTDLPAGETWAGVPARRLPGTGVVPAPPVSDERTVPA